MSPFLTFRRSFSRSVLWAAVLCGSGSAAHADEAPTGAGQPGEPSASRWQGRLGLTSPASFQGSTGRAGSGSDTLGARSSLSLLGDYYFNQRGLAAQGSYGGGFRATGGLFVGSRSNLWLATPATLSAMSTGVVAQRRGVGWLAPATPATADSVDGGSVPYVGVGYTGLKSLRATGGGWGFSADVGLMALQPRSLVRLGPQGAGDLQLSPLLQLGVSYSF